MWRASRYFQTIYQAVKEFEGDFILESNFEENLPNFVVSLRIVPVASGERSVSKLKLIASLGSSMTQERSVVASIIRCVRTGTKHRP